MIRIKNIFKKSIVLTISGIAYSIIQWAIYIYVARFIGQSEAGEFAWILAVVSPAIMFANFGVRTLITTSNNNNADVFLLLARITLLLVVFIFIYVFYRESDSFEYLKVLFIFKAFDSFAEALYGVFQKLERFDIICISRLTRCISYLMVLVVCYIFKLNFLHLLLALLSISFILLLIFDCRLAILNYDIKTLDLHLTNMDCKFIISSGIALSITLYLNSILVNYPRIIIEGSIGREALHIFVSISYLFVFSDAFFQAVNSISLRRLSNIKDIRTIGGFILINITLIIVGFILIYNFSNIVLGFIYGIDFKEYQSVILILSITFLLNNFTSCLGCILTASNKNALQPLFVGVAFLALISYVKLYNIESLLSMSVGFLVAILTKFIFVSIYLFITIKRNSNVPKVN